MKKIGRILEFTGTMLFVIGGCCLDTDGTLYSNIIMLIAAGIVLALAGYGMIQIAEKIFCNKKTHPRPSNPRAFLLKAE